jgi:hypothetical protein
VLTRLVIVAACVLTFAATAWAAEPQERLICVTYQVADLITPPAGEPGSFWGCRPTQATREDRLICQIVRTVQPTSWHQNGGRSTIQYFAPTMSLVVRHTPAAQEQIADLLERLRNNQDTQVCLEFRILRAPDDVMEGFGIKPGATAVGRMNCEAGLLPTANECQPPRCQSFTRTDLSLPLCLSDVEMFLLRETVVADARTVITHEPKLTVADSQEGRLTFSIDSTAPPLTLRAVPAVSADRRYVKLALHVEQKDCGSSTETKETVTIPDGGTVLIGGLKTTAEVQKEVAAPLIGSVPYVNRLFRTVATVREPQRVFVLVTPRVIIAQEVEESIEAAPSGAGTPPMCSRAQVVPRGEPLRVQFVPPAATEPLSRQAKVLADILRAYEAACDEGRGEESEKLARAALVLDPACFHRKR